MPVGADEIILLGAVALIGVSWLLNSWCQSSLVRQFEEITRLMVAPQQKDLHAGFVLMAMLRNKAADFHNKKINLETREGVPPMLREAWDLAELMKDHQEQAVTWGLEKTSRSLRTEQPAKESRTVYIQRDEDNSGQICMTLNPHQYAFLNKREVLQLKRSLQAAVERMSS